MPTDSRVVVIDDHAIVGFGVKQALAGTGLCSKILWFRSVAKCEWREGDVAVLDLRLDDDSTPESNAAYLNARSIPFVIYTSGDQPDLLRRAIKSGALSVVRKTGSARDLVCAIEAAKQGLTCPGMDWASALDGDEDFVASLSETEVQVLTHYAVGSSSEVVAKNLNISIHTVNTYISRIRDKYRKVGRPAESRVDLFRRAAEDGLVSYFDQ